jgi:hypothetical protein
MVKCSVSILNMVKRLYYNIFIYFLRIRTMALVIAAVSFSFGPMAGGNGQCIFAFIALNLLRHFGPMEKAKNSSDCISWCHFGINFYCLLFIFICINIFDLFSFRSKMATNN